MKKVHLGNLLNHGLTFFLCHLINCIDCIIDAKLLNRSISSWQLLEIDENDNCYFPPYCDLDIDKCNIDKISGVDSNWQQIFYMFKH